MPIYAPAERAGHISEDGETFGVSAISSYRAGSLELSLLPPEQDGHAVLQSSGSRRITEFTVRLYYTSIDRGKGGEMEFEEGPRHGWGR